MHSILIVEVLLNHDPAAKLLISIVVNSVVFKVCGLIDMQLLIRSDSVLRSVNFECNIGKLECLQVSAFGASKLEVRSHIWDVNVIELHNFVKMQYGLLHFLLEFQK